MLKRTCASILIWNRWKREDSKGYMWKGLSISWKCNEFHRAEFRKSKLIFDHENCGEDLLYDKSFEASATFDG